jgi:hypothetical protein
MREMGSEKKIGENDEVDDGDDPAKEGAQRWWSFRGRQQRERRDYSRRVEEEEEERGSIDHARDCRVWIIGE